MKKIAIIGAGSLVFSSRLTADVLSYEENRETHFALVDIDEKRLRYAGQIAERIFREGNYTKASYSLHADRRDALRDADAVIISILVGGGEAIRSEIDIPASYGLDQCIGDTLTPGGIMRCLRTLPVMIDIGRDIMDICPDAWVLNYTNPMSMLTDGLLQAVPGLKLVGLCHSVQATIREWATRMELPLEELDYRCAGINHQAWFISIERHGKDLLPNIRNLCTRQNIWNGDTVRMEYVKHLGFPVTESSGHCSEYSPWFRKRPELIERYCCTKGNEWNGGSGFIKTLYSDHNWEDDMKKLASGEKPIPLERSVEYGAQIINALAGGKEVVIYGNVPNKGLIDNLPEGACVEVACKVTADGLLPLPFGPLPDHLAAINCAQIAVQKLAVSATLETNSEKVFQAMSLDPLTGACLSLDEIRKMTRELMQAHAEWIPQFTGNLPEEKKELWFSEDVESEQHVDPGLHGSQG